MTKPSDVIRWVLLCAIVSGLAVPVQAWLIEELPASLTLPESMRGESQLGWMLLVDAASEPVVDPTIRFQGQEVRIRGRMAPGARLALTASGELVGLTSAKVQIATAPKPLAVDRAGDPTLRIESASGGRIDFRLLPAKATGWHWPDGGFESTDYRFRVLGGEGEGDMSARVSYRGRRSVHLVGRSADAVVVAESPYIPTRPADFGIESGRALLGVGVKVKARDVQWPESDRHGGGPRITLRYYDADHKYLFQTVITNRAGANPPVQGTTDGFVFMRGLMSRMRADAPIHYVRICLAIHGIGELWYDDLQVQPVDTLFQEHVQQFRWVQPLEPASREMPELSPEQKRRGYVAFRHDPGHTLLPNYRPGREDLFDGDEGLSITAARGEVASTTVGVINAGKGDQRLAVEFIGESLPGEWVQARPVQIWMQKIGTVGLRVSPTPEILLDEPWITLPQGESRQLWLTIRVPQGAAAGSYRGALVFKGEQGTQKVALKLKVRPITLAPNRRVAQEMFYHYTTPMFGSSCVPPGIMRAEFADMVDHGINMVHTQRLPSVTISEAGEVAISLAPLRPILDALKETGLNRGFPISLYYAHFDQALERASGVSWSDPRFAGWYTQAATQLDRALREEGFDGVLLRMEDEPGNYPHLQRQVLDQLKALADSPAKSYMNTGDFSSWVRQVASMVDVMRVYGLTDSVRDTIEQTGKHFFFSSKSSEERELQLQRISGGLVAYKAADNHGLGVSWYTYRTSAGNPYEEEQNFLSKAEMSIYPDLKTGMPRATLQWEAVRTAINDLRYMLTLDEALQSLTKHGGANGPLAEQIMAARKDILDRFPLDSHRIRAIAASTTSDEIEAIRDRISTLILQVQRVVGEGGSQ